MNKILKLFVVFASIVNILCLFNEKGFVSSDKKVQARNSLINEYQETKDKLGNSTFIEIDQKLEEDPNYLYKALTVDPSTQVRYHFSYTSSVQLDVHFGALSIIVDPSATGQVTGITCTFVDKDADDDTMTKAIEETIRNKNSYCIGSQSPTNLQRYNYIFKYEYQNDSPKKMAIQVLGSVKGEFKIYMLKTQGEEIERTDFTELRKYGEDEAQKKSVVPYIIDVNKFRNIVDNDYVSKILFYSKDLEMQMYYVSEESNAPIKLFCGNIALVYTKPQLAIQKYHSTKLVLITENLEGKVQPYIGLNFRFHTKMFKSDAQIEFFLSQNEKGRTLNYPLSIEMNTCLEDNNKLYYILNYNQAESLRTLHLDMIFGSFLTIKIAKEINEITWDELISYGMEEIKDYQIDLPQKSQHFDIIEIECKSPLLLNAYYSYDSYVYNKVKKGEIVVKKLPSKKSFTFSIEKPTGGDDNILSYSMSLFNSKETANVVVQFPDGTQHNFRDNTIETGKLMFIPDNITIYNYASTETRFIFKYGYGISESEGWEEVSKEKYDGTLFKNNFKYVYRFPTGVNRYNFTKAILKVTAKEENIKFCYSTNLGIAIEASKENCFRTGKDIPYNLTFINPLIIRKNYKNDEDPYFILLSPVENNRIEIEVEEEKYETIKRNKDGEVNLLTLSNGKVGAILSLAKQENNQIITQLKSCTEHTDSITYIINNAYSRNKIGEGKVKYTDKYGIKHFINNIFTENEIQLLGPPNTLVYTKHTSYSNYNLVIQDNYKVTFDSEKNTASIEKPIHDEEFTITIIVGKKDSLKDITQCTLATKDKKKYGDYTNTFVSSASTNLVVHYIDFESFEYEVGDEFDLLVYAEQNKNTKLDFIYPVITGKVGLVNGVVEIKDFIQENYVSKTFNYSSSSNYLFYDFIRKPIGDVASLKIVAKTVKINKVGCVFTSTETIDVDMIKQINEAMASGKSVCIGENQKDSDGFDALIKADYGEKKRLVIQILYGFSKDNEKIKDGGEELVINLRVTGEEVGENEGKYGDEEMIAPIPYVIDLLKIRKRKVDDSYVSKVLFYSSTREMEMFYMSENEYVPKSLFTGNLMLVYTNETLIKQKYFGATTMILLTDALSAIESQVLGEQFRFSIKHFDSQAQVQYFLSGNPNGRLLNNPTTIEMTDCRKPFYYILNYNHVEKEKKYLHIDTIYGERNSIKIATTLKGFNNWDELVNNLVELKGEQRLLTDKLHHFDVIEVTCNLPLLLNVYYTDPEEIKTSNLEIGDITVISLAKESSQVLTFKKGMEGPFTYSFNVYNENNEKPNIEIVFEDDTKLEAKENGVYIKDSMTNYNKLTIYNRDPSSSVKTRIIFKFGYVIESRFEEIGNDIYSNQNEKNRTINLYGYKYDNSPSKLNYTRVDFHISTTEDNVKFCYSSNLGTYIIPSLQNCFRVGKDNSYTISTLNPSVMYKNYYYEDINNYYIGFRTVELLQNIKITPIVYKYDTMERNIEEALNKVKIVSSKKYSTILTAPKNNEPYIFTQIQTCTKNQHLRYQFLNAYNQSNLGYDGEIPANKDYHYKSIINTKLDTELKLFGENGVEVFIKHIGLPEKYQPTINVMEANYSYVDRNLEWTQPIEGEEFKYTIYIDKKGIIKEKEYNLCNITEVQLTHYSLTLVTKDKPKVEIPDIGSEKMDFIIVAEQINNGKLILLSRVFDSDNSGSDVPIPDNPESKTGLIVIIGVLSAGLVAGCIVSFIIYRKYKSKGEISSKNKETSMALITNTQGGKMVESQAQEPNQIDP